MHVLPANRATAGRYLASVCVLLVAPGAFAASSSCPPSDTSLPCRLTGVLNWLEVAAVILALILLAVIALAFHLIRKNQINRRDER